MGDFKNIQWLSKLFPLKFCQHYVLQKINWNVLYFGHFGRLWNRKRKHEKKQQTTLPTQMASAKVFGLFVSALFFKNMWQRFIFYLNRAKENLSFQSLWLQGKMSLFFENGLLDYFFFFPVNLVASGRSSPLDSSDLVISVSGEGQRSLPYPTSLSSLTWGKEECCRAKTEAKLGRLKVDV